MSLNRDIISIMASVIYIDTIVDLGIGDELANYGEYSGNPNTEETYQYAKTILDLATRHPDGDGRALLRCSSVWIGQGEASQRVAPAPVPRPEFRHLNAPRAALQRLQHCLRSCSPPGCEDFLLPVPHAGGSCSWSE